MAGSSAGVPFLWASVRQMKRTSRYALFAGALVGVPVACSAARGASAQISLSQSTLGVTARSTVADGTLQSDNEHYFWIGDSSATGIAITDRLQPSRF